jgi:hypothetical protein
VRDRVRSVQSEASCSLERKVAYYGLERESGGQERHQQRMTDRDRARTLENGALTYTHTHTL